MANADRARTVLGWTPAFPDLGNIISSAWEWFSVSSRGFAPRLPWGSFGSAVMCWVRIAMKDSPANGTVPQKISYMMTPIA